MLITFPDLIYRMLDYYLKRWQLTIDGTVLTTPSSQLLAVRLSDNSSAILKITADPIEKMGQLIMRWWDGCGAAKVLAQHNNAILLEQALNQQSLLTMAVNGQANQATTIMVDVTKQLHSLRKPPPPTKLITLAEYFTSLTKPMVTPDPSLAIAAHIANELLNSQQDTVVLHGDIHHGNVLDFARGWLAIDAKPVLGESNFDYARQLCNPELAIANHPDYFSQQLNLIAQLAGIAPTRLLKWLIAQAGLSAVWFMEEQQTTQANFVLSIAKIGIRLLNIDEQLANLSIT